MLLGDKKLKKTRKFDKNVLIIPYVRSWPSQVKLQNYALRLGSQSWLVIERFRVKTEAGIETFREGSYVVRYAKQSAILTLLNALAGRLGAKLAQPTAQFTALTIQVGRRRVGILSDAGSPYAFYDVLSSTGFDCVPISSSTIRKSGLEKVDIVLIPGGGFKGPTFQSAVLRKSGRANLRRFVSRGGAVWGSCAGAIVLVSLTNETRVRLSNEAPGLPTLRSSELVRAQYWGDGDMGIGLVEAKLTDRLNPLTIGLPDTMKLTWHLGPSLTMLPDKDRSTEALIHNWRLTAKYTPAECLKSNYPLKRTYTWRSLHSQTDAIIASKFGRGLAVASGAHPEFGPDMLLEKWGDPARILVNFAQIAANLPFSKPARKSGRTSNFQRSIRTAYHDLRDISKLINRLQSHRNGRWLSHEYAPSSFGASAIHNWPIVLRRMKLASKRLPYLLAQAAEVKAEALPLMSKHITFPRNSTAATYSEAQHELQTQLSWLDEDFSAGSDLLDLPESDYGWQSIPTLLSQCRRKLSKGLSCIESGHLNYGGSNPYMLVWGMYLGAVFDLINCEIMLRRRLERIQDLFFILRELVNS
jgi:hypothetical protein